MNPSLGHVSFPNAQSQQIQSKQPTAWAAAGPDSLVQLAGEGLQACLIGHTRNSAQGYGWCVITP